MDFDVKDDHGNSLSVKGEDNLFAKFDKLIPKTRKERSEIVEAGVPAVQKNLQNSTPEHEHKYRSNNYLRGKLRNPLHLKEAVTHLPNQYIDGSTDVGFSSQAAPIARWVDQGTYRQEPQFFIEHSFEELDKNEVFDPEIEVYKQILHSEGIDIK